MREPCIICTILHLASLFPKVVAGSAETCERLSAQARLSEDVELPPWAAHHIRGAIIQRNLSALSLSFPFEVDWTTGEVASIAGSTFDTFVQHANLAKELTDAERDAYRDRFVAHMRLEFECKQSNLAWQVVASRAFESEKPLLTKLLTAHLLGLSGDGERQSTGAPILTATHPSFAPPPHLARELTTYEWCDCNTGLDSVVFWSPDDPHNRIIVRSNSSEWLVLNSETGSIRWLCNGMSKVQSTRFSTSFKSWSIQLFPMRKRDIVKWMCDSFSGRMRVNTWSSTDFVSTVPFTSNTEGYACMKIPSLLRTDQGTLLAFAEARTPDCSDFARTDLVYKRSTDGGRTWSALSSINASELDGGLCGAPLVVGNAAPVQLSRASKHYPGRILLPHVHNNFHVWLAHSDDDGITWSTPVQIPNVTQTDEKPDCKRGMSYYGFDIDTINFKNIGEVIRFAKELAWGKSSPFDKPGWRDKMRGSWQFMGLGPPASLQLRSGRVLTPGYHSWLRGLSGGNGSPGQLPISQIYNNLAFGHVMITDDGGDTWRLSSTAGFNHGMGQGANEDQLVQLSNGSVLVNSRSFATGTPQYRVQARSDDDGETFTSTGFVQDLPEPFNGCQGSFVRGQNDTLYLSHPNPARGSGLVPDLANALKAFVNLTGRDHMTLFKSVDGGMTYPIRLLLDPGETGYSSMQYHNGKLYILYEQADPAPADILDMITGSINVEVPTRFIFREIDESNIPYTALKTETESVVITI